MPDEDINPRTAAAKKFDLSKKVGPFPLYVWVASGVALLAGAYFLWKKHTASSTAATTPAATTTATGTTTGTGATGTGYQQYWPTSPTTPATTGYTAPTNEVQAGSGYSPPSQAPNSPISDAAGNEYTWISTSDQSSALLASGATIYYQPLPGVFLPVPPGFNGLAGGTAQWYMSQPAARGTGLGGGTRAEARPLSVLGHMIRNGARGTA
jgi:hypothetical protein